MTRTITFNELRRIKDKLPTGSMKKIADKLNSVMDTARDVVSGFLINAPEREGLLSFIQN